jgi:hypothetical protein
MKHQAVIRNINKLLRDPKTPAKEKVRMVGWKAWLLLSAEEQAGFQQLFAVPKEGLTKAKKKEDDFQTKA